MKIRLFTMIAITLALIFCTSGLYAQSIGDPVYTYIDRWEARGYLEPLYVLRPYSPEVIKAILGRVIELGGPEDARVAGEFLAAYGASSFGAQVVHRSDARLGSGVFDYRGETGARLGIFANVLPTIWTQGVLDVVVIDGNSVVKPISERSSLDIGSDSSMNILPVGLSGDAMGVLYGLSSATWFGSESLWGSASYARSSAGPFFSNGVVIGPQAHSAPNWNLNAAFGSWRFSFAMYQLTASDGGADKYLAYHSYSYAPSPRIDLGIFESAVWGGTFKPLYAIPLSMMFYLQSLSNFSDNSLAGLYATWRPIDGLIAKGTVYLDDVGFSDIISLDLDTKIIGAAQAGLLWAPPEGIASLVSLDYTAILPYMYAHHALSLEDDYTHNGDSFGAALQPNSDRWELRARFTPTSALSVDAVSRFMRHGNASEGITSGDGTWFDDGWDGTSPTYQEPYVTGTSPEYFRFLTQDTLETTFQIGATVSWLTTLGKTKLSVSGRYLIEAIWNEGLVAGDNALYHYFGLDVTWKL